MCFDIVLLTRSAFGGSLLITIIIIVIVIITRSAFGGPLLQGVPSVGMGERIEGQCFPLVFKPNKITFNSFQNPNF